jgi:hypothetical protein
MPAYIILAIIYLFLAVLLLFQLFSTINEKFKSKKRLFTIGLLVIVLLITFIKPFGIVNFRKSEDDSLLIAQREGAANCMTTFKLQENNRFKERNVCFGIAETQGDYEVRNDTIFFSNIEYSRNEDEYYKFALIKPSNFSKGIYDLVLYKNNSDTNAYRIWILYNELKNISNHDSDTITNYKKAD